MRWMFKRTALWLWLTAVSAAVAFAAGQVELPEGQGRNILEADCTRCHTLDRVADKKWDKETWQAVVESMRDNKRAEITDENIVIVVDYLVKNFGPGAPATDSAGSSNAADSKTADSSNSGAVASTADAAAEKLVNESCTACHGLDLVSTQRLAKDDWDAVVKGMVAMGAPLTDQQIPPVVDYLAKTYGPETK